MEQIEAEALPVPDFRKNKSAFPTQKQAYTEVEEASFYNESEQSQAIEKVSKQYKCCSMPTYEDEEVEEFQDQAYLARKSNLETSIKSPEAGSVISMEACDYMPQFNLLNKPKNQKN